MLEYFACVYIRQQWNAWYHASGVQKRASDGLEPEVEMIIIM